MSDSVGSVDAGEAASACGRFIVFEGGEGSGKSTQAGLLAEQLGAVLTHQPGGTVLGAELRGILLEGVAGDVVDRAEALLMAADRAQHVAEVIRPALASGRHVVCDRYIGSSVAYQGHGRELGADRIRDISEWAVDGLQPDLVVLLAVDDDVALERTGGARDRIEAAGAEFHERVRRGFVTEAGAGGRRWVVLDGAGTVADVAARVTDAVREHLGVLHSGERS